MIEAEEFYEGYESEDDLASAHYKNLAEQYNDFLVYSDGFVAALARKMVEHLDIKPDENFVDLGGGTGIFTKAILERVKFKTPALLVEPYKEMLDQVGDHPGIECLQMDGLDFSAKPGQYDKIMIKEAVHHIEDRAGLFSNLYERLNSGGILLLVHVPPKLNYPLFDAALKRAEERHADPDELFDLLEKTGYEVGRDFINYPQSMPKFHYFRMVKQRYMSTLYSFSDEELAEGLKEMEEKYKDQETLNFDDHFDYLIAKKP